MMMTMLIDFLNAFTYHRQIENKSQVPSRETPKLPSQPLNGVVLRNLYGLLRIWLHFTGARSTLQHSSELSKVSRTAQSFAYIHTSLVGQFA